MRFSSLTRAVDRTAAACSLQTQAGAPAGQAAQSAVQRSPPSLGYYSFNWPQRDGRLSWPCWLTDSGRRTHKVVKQPSISLAQDKESPPARTDVLTTMLCHQLCTLESGPIPSTAWWTALAQCSRAECSMTVHRCFKDKAPKYLIDHCIPVSDVVSRQHLRICQLTLPYCSAVSTKHVQPSGLCCWGPNGLELITWQSPWSIAQQQ